MRRFLERFPGRVGVLHSGLSLGEAYDEWQATAHWLKGIPDEFANQLFGNVADGVTFTSLFRPGQVLFGKRRAYQRKVAVAEFDA